MLRRNFALCFVCAVEVPPLDLNLLWSIRPSVHQVTNIITTATAIVPVHNHPIAHSTRGSTKRPITSGRIAISMMITISGTATTPLITADQNSALIGSSPTKLMTIPIRVDTAMVP